MEITLRIEQPVDYRETENVTREAFWNHFSPGCDEHYLLHIMRDCPAFLPELSIIATDGDKIVGNVVFMKAMIHGDDGKDWEVLSLGPIAVLPEYQQKGVGAKLIEYAKGRARQMGFRGILLYGDPEYYSRRGFVPAEQLFIRTADNMYAAALQVCELYEGALLGITGRYVEDQVFELDQKAAAEFDKAFPKKELVSGTPSQKRFLEIVAMWKKAEPKI